MNWQCKRNISTLMASESSCVPCNANSYGVYSCPIAIIERARQNATVFNSKRATDLVTSLVFLSAVFRSFFFCTGTRHTHTHAHREKSVHFIQAKSIKINTNINPPPPPHLNCHLSRICQSIDATCKKFPLCLKSGRRIGKVRSWQI